MEEVLKSHDPLTIDLTKSLGYHLYSLPMIGDHFSSQYPFAEKFYSLHSKSIRCQIYEKR